MPVPGGAAGKLGIRFERWWTVYALLDVMNGSAEWLRVEIPHEHSAEFCVLQDGVRVWHQAKRQHSRGAWTVARLVAAGVLGPWWDKLVTGDRCVFASGTSADELRELVDRARDAESWTEFEQDFLRARTMREGFDRLRVCWGHPSPERVHDALRRIEVRSIDESSLSAAVVDHLRAITTGDPADAADELGKLVENSLHRRITAPSAWDTLAMRGVQRRVDRSGLGDAGAGPPGQPIAEVRPADLEVLRAATPQDAGSRPLPQYIARAHDSVLRDLAAAALADPPRSGVTVLISDSTSGKSRALYEALHVPTGGVGDTPQSLASAGWRVWPGANPVPAQRFLAELPLVGPRTVIWLNEAQRYLVEPDEHTAQAIAAELREVLTDPARTPVLVLGTLWPEYLDEVARQPPRGQPDHWANARALLVGNTHRVPDDFHGADLDAARTNPDPLIQAGIAAADTAVGGRAERVSLTQYVAGVPALVDFYANATTTVQAVLHATMDCRRLGHGEWLPVPLLHHAAPAYLDDRQRAEHLAAPEWFAKALDALTAMRPGGARALHRPPVLPGRAPDDVVKLEDFLDQLGRGTRRHLVPPQGFWDAVLDHAATPDDHHRLSVSAHRRRRLRIAHALTRRAADGGSVDSLLWQAQLCRDAGRRDEAERLLRRAADLGNIMALQGLVFMRKRFGDHAGAVEFALRAAAVGYMFPLRRLADMCVEAGAVSDAEELLQRAVGLGDPRALTELANLRDEAGQHTEALDLAHAAAAEGYGVGLVILATRQQRAGRHAEAEELACAAAAVRHPMALTALALKYYHTSEQDKAEELLLRAIDMGYLKACRALAHLREWAGDRDGAEEILRWAVASGDTALVRDLLVMREEEGDHAEADALALRAAVTGDIRGLQHLIRVRKGTVREAGTEQLLRRAVDEGSIGALELLVDSRERAADLREAEKLARRAADAGMNGPLLRIAQQHWSHDAHNRLARYGLEPNGSVSQPW